MALAIRDVTAKQDLQNRELFSAFYDQALPVVYGYFLRRTGGMPALAEDLTQETFLAAVRQIQRGAMVVDAPMPWLVGIARHRLVDHYWATSGPASRVVSLGAWIDDHPDDQEDFTPILEREQAVTALDALASQRLGHRPALSRRNEYARDNPPDQQVGACRRIPPRARPRIVQTTLSGARS